MLGWFRLNKLVYGRHLPLPLLIFSLSSLLCWSQPTNGYVVSWNNDTLQVKILYIDILHLQQELKVESPKGAFLKCTAGLHQFYRHHDRQRFFLLCHACFWIAGCYRAMVTTKNQRAVDRWVVLGTWICAAILVPLSL